MKRILIWLLLLACVVSALPVTTLAVTPVDVNRSCSLTLHYCRRRMALPQMEIQGYRVASVNPDGSYDLVERFGGYGVDIYGITTQLEWQEVAQTLSACAAADTLAPDLRVQTDEAGTAAFPQLQTGMYLFTSVTAQEEETVYEFEDFLVQLPGVEEDGGFSYQVTAFPKYVSFSVGPPKVDYQVVKLWKDDGENRPEQVTVEILRDGALFETQILSAENQWSYTWQAPRDGSIWQVVERQVPEGYQVTVSDDGFCFQITNTRLSETPDSPITGDSALLWHWMVGFFLSGALLMLLCLPGKKARA